MLRRTARRQGQMYVSWWPPDTECSKLTRQILTRVHENLPEHFPSANPADYTIVEDLVGFRPLRPAGVRAEKEVIGTDKVVHAYGTTIGGYIHSFGLAEVAARLVEEFVKE
jgi:D-amino-acid oxidase